MRIRIKKSLSLTLAALLGIFHLSHAAHAQSDTDAQTDTKYGVEMMLYRVGLSANPGDIEYYENGRSLESARKKIEDFLKKSGGAVLEDIYLADVVDVITKRYEIDIIIDDRVVRPKETDPPDQSANQSEGAYATDGKISYVNLRNATLREMLKAILRPLGLDFSIQSSFIWISTPEYIASESFGLLYRPSSTFTFRQEGAYVLYDKETIVLGRPELTWSGKPEPAATGIARLASSKFMATEGQESEIRVGDSTPIQYFEPMETNTGTAFRLRTLQEPIGIVAKAVVTSSESPQEADVKLSLSANIVGDRASLDGVFLNIGEPFVSRTEHSDTHRVVLGRWASLLGSADTGSALLLLFKVSPSGGSPEGAVEHASQSDIKEKYVIEAKFVRYRGRLNKEKLNSKLAGSGANRVGLNVFRLGDGILPLRRKNFDFTDPEVLNGTTKLRGLKLINASRMTILGKEAWSREDTKYKLQFPSGSPVAEKFLDFDRGFRVITQEGYQLPISMDQLTGSGIIVDVDLDRIPYADTRDVNGETLEVNGFFQANTGILLAVRVDDTIEAHPVMLDIYAQVRVKTGEMDGQAKSREAAAAGLSFFDFQDRVEFSDGGWLTYFTSLSDEEHYITLVSVKKKPYGN